MPFLHCVYQRVEISRSARFFSPAALLFSFLFSFFPFLFFFRRSLQTFHLLSFSFSFSILQLFSSRFVLSRLNGKEAMAIWRSRENETSGEGDIDTVPRLYRQYLGAYTTNTPGPRKDIWRPLLETRQLLTHPEFCLFPPRLSVRQSRGQQTLLPFTNDPPNSVCLFSLFILIVSFLLHFFFLPFGLVTGLVIGRDGLGSRSHEKEREKKIVGCGVTTTIWQHPIFFKLFGWERTLF